MADLEIFVRIAEGYEKITCQTASVHLLIKIKYLSHIAGKNFS